MGSEEIDGSISSLAGHGHDFHLESPGETEDLLGHDDRFPHFDHHGHRGRDEHERHQHREAKEQEKGEQSAEEHESSDKEEASKGYKVRNDRTSDRSRSVSIAKREIGLR